LLLTPILAISSWSKMSPIRQSQLTSEPLGRHSAWRVAAAAGVDMSLLEHSLRLSPWERLVEHQHALELAETLQNAKIKPPCQT
jgi:hypothetical protein